MNARAGGTGRQRTVWRTARTTRRDPSTTRTGVRLSQPTGHAFTRRTAPAAAGDVTAPVARRKIRAS